MDEPLSNLDAKLRVQMRADIKRIQSDLGVTTIYVTHDQVEAMTMGDRVAVMRKGELQQVAPPEELYHRPLNVFVGGFIGSPAMNMLEATVERRNGALEIVVGEARIELGEQALAAHPALAAYEKRPIVLGIRPESLEDAALAGDDAPPAPRTGRASRGVGLGGARSLLGRRAARQSPTMSASSPRTSETTALVEQLRSWRHRNGDARRTLRPAHARPRGRHDRGRDRRVRAPLLRRGQGSRSMTARTGA